MAGALFENYCIQETLKIYFNNGKQPQLYYLRTNNNLEIDLLIEKSFQKVIPVEFKLNKTPNSRMAANINRFKKVFSKFDIDQGWLVSLSEQTFPLNRQTVAINFTDYVQKLSDLIISW